jgi:hypothetical protein
MLDFCLANSNLKKPLLMAAAFLIFAITSLTYGQCPPGVAITYNPINLPTIRINEVSAGLVNNYNQTGTSGGTQGISTNTISFDVNIAGNLNNDNFDGDVQNQNRFDKPVLWRVTIGNGDWDLANWDEFAYTTVVTNAGGGPDNEITLTGPNGSTIIGYVTTDFNQQINYRGNGNGPRRIRDGIFFEFDVSTAVESGAYTAVGGLDVEVTGSMTASENFLLGCP